MKRQKLLLKVFIGILLFLYMYTPPIFIISTIHIVSLISYILILAKFRNDFIVIMKTRVNVNYAIGMVLSILILFFVILSTTRNFDYLRTILYMLIEALPISILFCIVFKKMEMSKYEVINFILTIATFQAVISLVTFIFPEVRDFIIYNFYYEEYYVGELSHLTKNRIYGFTDGFTYAMPVLQSFLALVSLALGLMKSRRYIFYVPLLLFSAFINARISIIIFTVGSLIVIIYNIKLFKLKDFLKLLIWSIFFIYILYYFIYSISPISAEWISNSIFETLSIFRGESVGYYSALEEFIFFPEMDKLILGSGKDYFRDIYINSTTDIGYINDLFLGGIFFVIIYYFNFAKFIVNSFISSHDSKINSLSRLILVLIIVIMILSNIKGHALRLNSFTNVFILLAVVFSVNFDEKSIEVECQP